MLADHYLICWQQHETALAEVIYQLAKSHCYQDAAGLLFKPEFTETKLTMLGSAELLSDFSTVEAQGEGYFGLAGAAFQLLIDAEAEFSRAAFRRNGDERDRSQYTSLVASRDLFRAATAASRAWISGQSAAKACAVFAINVLQTFDLELRETSDAVATLRRCLANADDREILADARARLKPALIAAKNAPRKPRQYGPVANTAHLYEDYVENTLSVADAALALEPLRLLRHLTPAWCLKAVVDCDGDPLGAVSFASENARSDLKKLHRHIRALIDMPVPVESHE